MSRQEDKERDELEELVRQMQVELSLMEQAVTELRDDYGKEHSDEIVRSQLIEMKKLIQSTNAIVGEGESRDITNLEEVKED